MANVIRSNARLALPSSVVATTMSEAERVVASMPEIDFWIDPAERAMEYSGLTLRDRMRGQPLPVTGGTQSTVATGSPALAFANTGLVAAPYVMPPSYFVAVALELTAITDTAQLAGSDTQTGQRLLFGLLSNGTLRLDHGTGTGQSVQSLASVITPGIRVLWGTYDAESGAAEVGRDAVSPLASGVINVAHKASAISHFLGSSGTPGYGIEGKAAGLVVANRFLGSGANTARRTAILSYLAGLVGASLAP